MRQLLRFGRRMALPSTAKIKHDLKMSMAIDDARSRCAIGYGLPAIATWDEIIAHRASIAPTTV